MAAGSASAVSPLRALGILARVQVKSSMVSLGGGGRGVLRGLGRALTCLLYAGLGVLISLSVAVMLALIDPSLIPGAAVLLAGIVAVALTFQSASGSLFGFRDYDQVMSLPVPTWVVVLSRVGSLFAVQVAVSAVLMLPMFAVAALLDPFGPMQVATAVVAVAFASALPVSVAVFLSFCLAVAASRFRYSNIVYLVASFAVLAAAMAVSFAAAGASSADVDEVVAFLDGLVRVYPLAGWVMDAWAGNLGCLAPFCLVSLAFMVACVAILSRHFMHINAALSGHGASCAVDVDAKAGHRSGVLKAMVVKELKCVVNTPVYAFNAAGGLVFILFFTVLMLVMGKQGAFDAAGSYLSLDAATSAAMSQLSEAILPWLFFFCMTAATSAAASVSMEGSANWVMATAPVPRRTVLGSKVLASAIPLVGTLLVCSLALMARGVLSPAATLTTLFAGTAGHLFEACLGLMIDAAAPRFDWIKPAEAVKSGRSVMAVALSSIVISFGGGAASIALCMQMGEPAALAMTLAVAAVLSVSAWACFTRAENGTLVPGETVPPRP